MSEPVRTFLAVRVGEYRLALRAHCVLGVLDELPAAERVAFRGTELPYADLAPLFAGEARPIAPFAVAFEGGEGAAVVGVDAVGHIRPGAGPRLVAMPPFGLLRPELFEGVLRDGDERVLVLAPAALARLTAAKSDVI